MPWDNSLNPGKGRDFQELAAQLISERLGLRFLLDHPLAIGEPTKLHRFDLVSEDQLHVGECKNYSWTESGNMPSAKMAFLNEAVLLLSHLPPTTNKFIAMRLDTHPRRRESLVQYYLRTYRHLLRGVTLFEIDPVAGTIEEHKA